MTKQKKYTYTCLNRSDIVVFMMKFLMLVPVVFALSSSASLADEIRIIDGDSFWLEDTEIRLWGIDAPEWNAEGGNASEVFLRGILSGVSSQQLACEQLYRDRYERSVARCILPDGHDLACLLVRAGHAVDWPRYSGGYYRRCDP